MKNLIDSEIETCKRNLKKTLCADTIKILKKRIEILKTKKGEKTHAKKSI